MLQRQRDQHAGGQEESEQHRDQAGRGGQGGTAAAQAVAGQGLVLGRGVMEALLAPGKALGQYQDHHEEQQHRGQLGRPGDVVHVHPDVEDAQREGVDGKEIDRAEIVQRLHQDQRQADHDARPGQRQGDKKETLPGPPAQHPAGLQHAHRLLDKGGPGEQIDIGVEHQRHHGGGAAQRADLGEPVVAPGGPAENLAQRPLRRAGIFQDIGVDVSDDVGRHGHREQQGPFENAPPGKAAHGHQPGPADADQQRAQANPQHQLQGRGDVARQHRRGQVRPDVVARRKGQPDDCRDGNHSGPGDGQRGDGPAVERHGRHFVACGDGHQIPCRHPAAGLSG